MISSSEPTKITILSNDYPNGILEFEQRTIKVTEEQQGKFLNITRKFGLFGKVCCYFRVFWEFVALLNTITTNNEQYSGAVSEWLRHRSREQKVPSSIPRLVISVEVTSQC